MRAALALLVIALGCGKREPAHSTTTLVVHVTEGGKPIGARVLLIGNAGPLHMGSLDLYGKRQATAACVIAPDVIGSWDGLIVAHGAAEVAVSGDACAIPYGRYKVWAWRGVEFERWEGEVDLSADRGRVELAIPLERAWRAAGTLSADLHVHAHASNDSTMPNPQRVIAQVAAGVQVIGLSDHNTNGDLDAEIHDLALDDVVASIASNELTTDAVHLGVYPVLVDRKAPRGGAPSSESLAGATPAKMFEIARSFPGHPIVQLNHPRFKFTALYDGTGWNGVMWPPPFPLEFDAVEVLAGYSAFNIPGDRRFDDSTRDLYTLYDHGHLVAPMGNSDTHDLNWVLDGTTRNYVFVDDPRTQPFDEAGFVSAIRARRVVATSGPWLDVEVARTQAATTTVGPGQSIVPEAGAIWLDVTVSQAKWMAVERIRITVGTPEGPKLVRTIEVPPAQRSFHWAGRVEVGAVDTFIGVTTDGDSPMPLELTGTYQKDRWNRPGVTPFAIASPILVDADGDGRWKRGDTDLDLRK
ncbi:MAG: hypothetical protein JWO36_6918 [Myxococcales bacterium]|nr:hypothetical protein [Myxococcales bacterium]